MAIVLDRMTTAASERGRDGRWRAANTRAPADRARRAAVVAAGGDLALPHLRLGGDEFPTQRESRHPRSPIAGERLSTWVQRHLRRLHRRRKDVVTDGLLNPFEVLLAESPWWRHRAVLVALACVARRPAGAVPAAVCLRLLVATCGTTHGHALHRAGGTVGGRGPRRRSRRLEGRQPAGRPHPAADPRRRPDHAAVRLPGPVPRAVRPEPVHRDRRRRRVRRTGRPPRSSPTASGRPVATVEAANSVGSSRWQVISKVQLPMARRSLTLAVNQGLIYVLSMVVVGGLVGAGALGYDVVRASPQRTVRQGPGGRLGDRAARRHARPDHRRAAASRRTGPRAARRGHPRNSSHQLKPDNDRQGEGMRNHKRCVRPASAALAARAERLWRRRLDGDETKARAAGRRAGTAARSTSPSTRGSATRPTRGGRVGRDRSSAAR